jgi:hypothetical protein
MFNASKKNVNWVLFIFSLEGRLELGLHLRIVFLVELLQPVWVRELHMKTDSARAGRFTVTIRTLILCHLGAQ